MVCTFMKNRAFERMRMRKVYGMKLPKDELVCKCRKCIPPPPPPPNPVEGLAKRELLRKDVALRGAGLHGLVERGCDCGPSEPTAVCVDYILRKCYKPPLPEDVLPKGHRPRPKRERCEYVLLDRGDQYSVVPTCHLNGSIACFCGANCPKWVEYINFYFSSANPPSSFTRVPRRQRVHLKREEKFECQGKAISRYNETLQSIQRANIGPILIQLRLFMRAKSPLEKMAICSTIMALIPGATSFADKIQRMVVNSLVYFVRAFKNRLKFKDFCRGFSGSLGVDLMEEFPWLWRLLQGLGLFELEAGDDEHSVVEGLKEYFGLKDDKAVPIVSAAVSIIVLVAAGVAGSLIPAGVDISKAITRIGGAVRGASSLRDGQSKLQKEVKQIMCIVFGMKPDDPEFTLHDDLHKEVVALIGAGRSLVASQQEDNTFVQVFPERFMHFRAAAISVLNKYSKISNPSSYIKSLPPNILVLTKLESTVSAFLTNVQRQANDKLEPTVIWVAGPSGVGKSEMTNTIVNKIGEKLQHIPSVYVRGTQKYWDNYSGQEIVRWDDLGAAVEADDFVDFCTQVTPTSSHTNQANVNEKGMVFCSKFIVVTSNLVYVDAQNAGNKLTMPEILHRRRDVLVVATDPFYDPNGTNAHRKPDFSHLALAQVTPAPAPPSYEGHRSCYDQRAGIIQFTNIEQIVESAWATYEKKRAILANKLRKQHLLAQKINTADLAVPAEVPPPTHAVNAVLATQSNGPGFRLRGITQGLSVLLEGPGGLGKSRFCTDQDWIEVNNVEEANLLVGPDNVIFFDDITISEERFGRAMEVVTMQYMNNLWKAVVVSANPLDKIGWIGARVQPLRRKCLWVKIKAAKKNLLSRYTSEEIARKAAQFGIQRFVVMKPRYEVKDWTFLTDNITYPAIAESINRFVPKCVQEWVFTRAPKMGHTKPEASVAIDMDLCDLKGLHRDPVLAARVFRSLTVKPNGFNVVGIVKQLISQAALTRIGDGDAEAIINSLNNMALRCVLPPTCIYFRDSTLFLCNLEDTDRVLFGLREAPVVVQQDNQLLYGLPGQLEPVTNPDVQRALLALPPFLRLESVENAVALEYTDDVVPSTMITDVLHAIFNSLRVALPLMLAMAPWGSDCCPLLCDESVKKEPRSSKPQTSAEVSTPSKIVETKDVPKVYTAVPDKFEFCQWFLDSEGNGRVVTFSPYGQDRLRSQAIKIEHEVFDVVLKPEGTGADQSSPDVDRQKYREHDTIRVMQRGKTYKLGKAGQDIDQWLAAVPLTGWAMDTTGPDWAPEAFQAEAMSDPGSRDVVQSTLKNIGKFPTAGVYGLILNGNVGVAPSHAFVVGQEYEFVLDGVSYTATIKRALYPKDLVRFQIKDKQFPFAKSLLKKLLASSSQISSFRGKSAFLVIPADECVYVIPVRLNEVATYHTTHGSQYSGLKYQPIVTGGTYQTQYTRKGDCGSFLVLNDSTVPNKLIGLHVAATTQYGACALLTEDVAGNDAFSTEGLDAEPSVYIDPKRCVDLLAQNVPVWDGSATQIGVAISPADPSRQALYKRHENGQTTLFKSVFHDLVQSMDDAEFEPAILSSQDFRCREGQDPRIKAFQKWNNTVDNMDAEILDLCVDAVSSSIVHRLRLQQRHVRVLSTTEALNRWTEYDTSNPMFRNASPGFPYNGMRVHKKSQLLRENDKGLWELDISVPAGKLCSDQVGSLICNAQKGQRVPMVYQLNLKDEVRKKAKIDSCDTRSFAACPIDFTIAYRKYFHAAQCAIMSIKEEIPIKVGINPHSFETQLLFNYMTECGFEGWDVDFKGWDSTVPRSLMKIPVRIYEKIYQALDANWSEKDARTRATLMSYVHTPWMLDGSKVVLPPSGEPSGEPGTAIDNSLMNWVLFMYAFEVLKRRYSGVNVKQMALNMSFESFVRLAVYGDDAMLAPGPEVIDWYNYANISKVIRECTGMVVTPGNKDESDTSAKLVSKMTFLKRGFAYCRELCRIVMPLELASLKKCLSFVSGPHHKWKENEKPLFSANEHVALLSAFVLEARYHGKEFYDYWVTACRNKMLQCDMDPGLDASYQVVLAPLRESTPRDDSSVYGNC